MIPPCRVGGYGPGRRAQKKRHCRTIPAVPLLKNTGPLSAQNERETGRPCGCHCPLPLFVQALCIIPEKPPRRNCFRPFAADKNAFYQKTPYITGILAVYPGSALFFPALSLLGRTWYNTNSRTAGPKEEQMKKQTILARIAPLLLAAALALAEQPGSRPEKRAAPTDPNPRTGLCAHRLAADQARGMAVPFPYRCGRTPGSFFS